MQRPTLNRIAAFRIIARRESLALTSLCLALLISIGGWHVYSSREEQTARHRFDNRVTELTFRIRERLLAYEQVLQGALGFMSFSVEVDRNEWRSYVTHLRLEEIYPGIQGVGFAKRIRPDELVSHVSQVRNEGFPDYRVWPEGDRDDYTAIVYLEPFLGTNLKAFGYDMFSEPLRQQAMQRARDTGKPAISGKVRLVQETNVDIQSGFLMYLPLYKPASSHFTVEERREALAGYVYAPFRMGDLLYGILSNEFKDLNLEIFDGTAKASDALLYDSRPNDLHQALFTSQIMLSLYGHAWTVDITSLPEFEQTIDRQKPLLLLLAGILASFLIAGIVWALVANREKAATLARMNRDLLTEIAERRRTADSLHLLRQAVDSSVNAVTITDPNQDDNPIVYVNPAFERITGYTMIEVAGKNCRFLQGTDRDQPEREKMQILVRGQLEGHAVLRNYRKDGSLFWNEIFITLIYGNDGKVTHFVGFQKDITETRNYQKQLEHQATHDTLTGVANRGLLIDRANQAIRLTTRKSSLVAIVYIDIDRFKLVNDSLGHVAGDELLKALASRLTENTRQSDSVARISGDEFVVLLNDLTRVEEITDSVERIQQKLVAPYTISSQEMMVTCSIGVSISPEDGKDAETLLRNADAAMHRSKQDGPNTFRFYAREMNESASRRLTLANQLRHALKNEEFVLHYQPRVNLESGAIVGVEALIRWQHPEFGLLGPIQFIPLAEETGQIIEIGEWVLRRACLQNVIFRNNGFSPIRISVNISARQIGQKGLAELVRRVLDETLLPPEFLEIEITESMVMHDVSRAIELFDELTKMGIHIAIDDFGTGYSSLAYLKKFPINYLKIDKSFVKDITTDASDATVVTAIISMAHALGMRVTAEGVETEDQCTFLKLAKCDEMQGYLFSKPVPAKELEMLIRKQLP